MFLTHLSLPGVRIPVHFSASRDLSPVFADILDPLFSWWSKAVYR